MKAMICYVYVKSYQIQLQRRVHGPRQPSVRHRTSRILQQKRWQLWKPPCVQGNKAKAFFGHEVEMQLRTANKQSYLVNLQFKVDNLTPSVSSTSVALFHPS